MLELVVFGLIVLVGLISCYAAWYSLTIDFILRKAEIKRRKNNLKRNKMLKKLDI